MKILYVATVRSHIGQFHIPFIRDLKSEGHVIHAAFKDNSMDKKGLDLSMIDKSFEVPFARKPLKICNLKAARVLKEIINNEHYDLIHCHTPVGGVITRIASGTARKKGTKVFYTAHGFHFYKGAPLKNWLLFYPIEKILARITDVLIVINEEDYQLAIRKHFKAKKIVKIHGVGVELDKYDNTLRKYQSALRREYGFSEKDFIILYPADLSKRKNQKMLIQAVSKAKEKIQNIKLLLPGQPIQKEMLQTLAKKLGVEDNVFFMGYRRDVPKLIALSDLCVSSSRQEGLPMNIVEAMAMGRAVLATDVRGNADLVVHGKGGYLVPLDDSDLMASYLIELYLHRNLLHEMGEYNMTRVKMYSSDAVNSELEAVYEMYGNVHFHN